MVEECNNVKSMCIPTERVREAETHRRAQKYMYTDVHRRTQTGVIKYQFCDNGKDCARV